MPLFKGTRRVLIENVIGGTPRVAAKSGLGNNGKENGNGYVFLGFRVQGLRFGVKGIQWTLCRFTKSNPLKKTLCSRPVKSEVLLYPTQFFVGVQLSARRRLWLPRKPPFPSIRIHRQQFIRAPHVI